METIFFFFLKGWEEKLDLCMINTGFAPSEQVKTLCKRDTLQVISTCDLAYTKKVGKRFPRANCIDSVYKNQVHIGNV